MFSVPDLAVVGKLCGMVECSRELITEPNEFLDAWSFHCSEQEGGPGRGWMNTEEVATWLGKGGVLGGAYLRWLLPRQPGTKPDLAELETLLGKFLEISVIESRSESGQISWRPNDTYEGWRSPDKIVLWRPADSPEDISGAEVAAWKFADMQNMVAGVLSDYEGHRLLSIQLNLPAKSEEERWLRQQFYDFTLLYLREMLTSVGWEEVHPGDEKPYTVDDVNKAEEAIRAMWLVMSGHAKVLENGCLLEPLPVRPKDGSPSWMGPVGLTSSDIREQIKEDVQHLEQRLAQPNISMESLWKPVFSVRSLDYIGAPLVQENGSTLIENSEQCPLGLPWNNGVKKDELGTTEQVIIKHMLTLTKSPGDWLTRNLVLGLKPDSLSKAREASGTEKKALKKLLLLDIIKSERPLSPRRYALHSIPRGNWGWKLP